MSAKFLCCGLLSSLSSNEWAEKQTMAQNKVLRGEMRPALYCAISEKLQSRGQGNQSFKTTQAICKHKVASNVDLRLFLTITFFLLFLLGN